MAWNVWHAWVCHVAKQLRQVFLRLAGFARRQSIGYVRKHTNTHSDRTTDVM